jgi:hypothetical protein
MSGQRKPNVFTVRRPGLPAWAVVTDLDLAIAERDYANRFIQRGHCVYLDTPTGARLVSLEEEIQSK